VRPPVELRDGTHVQIRPLGPGDRDALAAGFERLSPESRYLRFFGPVPRLTEAQLRYLTDVDHHDHEALIAVDPDTGDGVGVARFVRTDARVAEPAIAVIDDWQGRGVGGVLLDQLADRAREEGIATFAAPVLAHNEAAIAALRRLGETRVERQGHEIELHIELGDPRAAAPTLQDLLRQAAEESIRPAVSFWHRLATSRRPRHEELDNVIVVAAPTSRRSHPPLRHATQLAGVTGAAVHLVAARRLLLGEDPDTEAQLAETAAELRGRGLAVECHLRRGDLAAVLLAVAVDTRARLIVVDGEAPPFERLLGSTWDHVAHHAPCDVLVVRERSDG
jgi:nucleotide-binding universal stress UspA family protein/RimJ/RimL family protein N-acetyltransferase